MSNYIQDAIDEAVKTLQSIVVPCTDDEDTIRSLIIDAKGCSLIWNGDKPEIYVLPSTESKTRYHQYQKK